MQKVDARRIRDRLSLDVLLTTNAQETPAGLPYAAIHYLTRRAVVE